MPAVANQLPSADQAVALPTEREQSSIPKGGTESTWLYPSPQMVSNDLWSLYVIHDGCIFLVLECSR